jgi:hypothetical protein
VKLRRKGQGMAKKETKPEDCQLCACVGCSEGNCCEHEGRRDVWEQLSSATGHSYFIQDIFKRKMSDLSDASLALSVGLNNKTLEWEERAAIFSTGVMAIQKLIDISDYEYGQVYNDPKCVACQCALCRKRGEDLMRRNHGNWGERPYTNTCCGHKEMDVHGDGLPF